LITTGRSTSLFLEHLQCLPNDASAREYEKNSLASKK
jgi:hypothetical protein